MKTDILQLPVLLRREKTISRKSLVGGTSLALMVVSGSVFPVFGKELTSAFSPLSLLFISEMMGVLFVLMSFGLLPLLRKIGHLRRRQKRALLAIGMLGGVIAPYLWFKGLQETSAVNAQLFSRSEMIFLIGLSVILLNEKITRLQVLSLGIVFAGVACVALHGFSVGIQLTMGDVLIVASSAAYSLSGVVVKKDLHSVPPEIIMFMRGCYATGFFLACSPFVSANIAAEFRAMPPEMLTALLSYGFIAKFLGIYSFHEAIETLKVSTVSMFSNLAIVGGMILAATYLHEQITAPQIAGAALIIFGVLMMQRTGVHGTAEIQEHHMRQHHRHLL